MKYCVFVLFSAIACLAASQLQAQIRQHNTIVDAIDRGDYIFIPPSALTNSVDGIVYRVKTNHKAAPDKIPIEFSWNSICNDGHYNLIITPEQIYFSSGHDNPNPNALFWVINIDRSTYESLKKGVLTKPHPIFKNVSKYYSGSEIAFKDSFNDLSSVPSNWTDAKYRSYCDAQLNSQLDKYFSILNSYITLSKPRLSYPKVSSPKLFSYSREEIIDWLPVEGKRK